jgi:uncharacterized protein YbjT (DUF2867 family)
MDKGLILVTGGTGTLGTLVVERLRHAQIPIRVLSRRDRPGDEGTEYVRGDLTTGEGVRTAAEGVERVIHCAGNAKGDEQMTAKLTRAASAAGVRHILFISVVGADRVPVESPIDRTMFGYFAAKRNAERVVENSGLPWTTLRATQFYELILLVAKAMAKLPVIPVPSGFRFQPVAANEVAGRLVELALGAPAGLAPDFAGPKIYPTKDLVSSYLRATGRRRPMIPLGLPGGAARAIRNGANLAPDFAVGQQTWEDFLTRSAEPNAQVMAHGV